MLSFVVRVGSVLLALLVLAYVLTPSLTPFTGGYASFFAWHPALMSTAVVLVLSQGVVTYIITYGKKIDRRFPDRKSRRALHGVIQVIGVGLAVSGVMVVVVDHSVNFVSNVKETSGGHAMVAHMWVGYASVALMLFQTATGFMKFVLKTREEKNVHPYHQTLGLLTYVLSVIALIIGFTVKSTSTAWSVVVTTLAVLLAVFVLVFVLIGPGRRRDRAMDQLTERMLEA